MELVLENGQIRVRAPSSRTDQWSGDTCTVKSSSCTSEVQNNMTTKIGSVGTLGQSKLRSSNYDKLDLFRNHNDSGCNNASKYLQQCEASNPHSKSTGLKLAVLSNNSIEDVVEGGLHNSSKIQEHDSVHSKKMGLMNFSHFSRLSSLPKPNSHSSDATRAVKLRDCTGKSGDEDFSNPFGSTLINSVSGSENVIGLNNQLQGHKVAEVGFRPLFTETSKEPLSHQQSRPVHDQVPSVSLSFAASAVDGKPNNAVGSIDLLAESSSASSWGASKDGAYTMKRKYQETEESAYSSEDDEEEYDGVKKQEVSTVRGSKRNPSSEMHILSERRRQSKISKKMRALQELIPNCTKMDKASMLDEAIEYMRTLQFQVQIMSMRSRFYTPPVMFPSGMQQMHAPHLTHYSPMGISMGLGMGIGSFSSGATALPGFIGFPGQVLPMPELSAPFTPTPGASSTP